MLKAEHELTDTATTIRNGVTAPVGYTPSDPKKWHKSKNSKRMPSRKKPMQKKGIMCVHSKAHRIHSGELWCPSCRLVVGHDPEDR